MAVIAGEAGPLLPTWQQSGAERHLYCQLGGNQGRIGAFGAKLAVIAGGAGVLVPTWQ
ncbi:MAG: hypothetical protein K6T83_11160 [Alicyclobacillus sp.]|nr:hypothetical protein [Alicyclobacillus sp.]